MLSLNEQFTPSFHFSIYTATLHCVHNIWNTTREIHSATLRVRYRDEPLSGFCSTNEAVVSSSLATLNCRFKCPHVLWLYVWNFQHLQIPKSNLIFMWNRRFFLFLFCFCSTWASCTANWGRTDVQTHSDLQFYALAFWIWSCYSSILPVLPPPLVSFWSSDVF